MEAMDIRPSGNSVWHSQVLAPVTRLRPQINLMIARYVMQCPARTVRMDKGGTNQMDSRRETLLEMERRHVREGTKRITRQEAIISKLGDGNRSDTAILAKEILVTMRSSLDFAKRRLRQIEELSKE
jgi:hypothetical protein